MLIFYLPSETSATVEVGRVANDYYWVERLRGSVVQEVEMHLDLA